MILTKYLSREVFKTQIAILFILLVIFFSQQLVHLLASATNGNVPTELVFSLLTLGIPTMIQLILPLSLFIGLMLALGRLYAESEITVMRACGVGQNILVKIALILSLFTAVFAAYNTFYLSPLSLKKQAKILNEAKANPTMSLVAPGQFVSLNDIVLFVDNIKKNKLQDIYIFQHLPTKNLQPSVITARTGTINSLPNGDQILHLEKTNRVEGNAGEANFRLTDFSIYEAYLNYKVVAEGQVKDEEMLTLPQLLKTHSQAEKAELHWRITLIISVPIMALIAIALCRVNPRQGRFAKILPALLLYLIYFLLQSSLKSAGASAKLDASYFMPLVNLSFLLFGILLNSWDSPLIYKWREQFNTRFAHKGMHK